MDCDVQLAAQLYSYSPPSCLLAALFWCHPG